jgi:hypothetical protein
MTKEDITPLARNLKFKQNKTFKQTGRNIFDIDVEERFLLIAHLES